MTSISKQDLTTSSNSLSISDVAVSVPNDHKKKNSLSHALIAGLAVTICICIILVVALVLVVTENEKDKHEDMVKTTPTAPPKGHREKPPCLTTECVRAASYLSQSLDETVDPCDDFYKFTCGNWKRRHVMAEDQSQISMFHELIDQVQISLKNVLETEVQNNDIDAIQKAKRTYQSCNNEAEIEKIGFSEVTKLTEELGGWPVLGSKPGGKWVEGKQSLQEQLTAIRRFSNSPPILDMYTYDDIKKIGKHVIYIDQPTLGMPNREYFLKGRDDKTLKAYENYALEVAKIFGADADMAANDTAEMIDFEIQIANMSAPTVERLDPNKLYNRMNISQLHQNYSDFNWTAYLTTVFGVNEVQITLTESEPVIVWNPDYMDRVFNYIKTVPKRVVSNYIIWRLVSWVGISLPAKVRDAYQTYRESDKLNGEDETRKQHRSSGESSKPNSSRVQDRGWSCGHFLLNNVIQVLIGAKYPQPRWKSCISSANGRLGFAVGRLFVDRSFDPEAKKKVLEMIKNLQFSMENLIRNNDWMDESTKTVAIEKVDFIVPRIGYFDGILNDTYLNVIYENLTAENKKFFLNTVSYMKNGAAENLRRLRKPVDRTRWDMAPAVVNAYYNPYQNQIYFPAGILQPPFYHGDYPQYLNYGGIGYVIGHEITHGFDNTGRLYDKYGELKSWWTQTSTDAFIAKSQCVVDGYGNYVVPEANKTLNGKLTLGENIADIGGIKESYYAYKKWVKENGEEAKLPGLKYTPEQLFFINGAHVWCNNIRPEEALRRIIVDYHSNGRSRTIGPAQNLIEFSKAFNCPTGSFMNPAKKCDVW